MRQFMSYIGIPEDTIRKLAIEAMREEEGDVKYEKKKFVTFKNKTLPKNAHKLDVWLEKYVGNDLTEPQWKKIDGLLKYLESRGIGPEWYDFMYSPDQHWDVNKRLLIPFYWRGDIVGFTGRMFEQSDKVKYYTDVQPGYVFNTDAQDDDRKYIVAVEGPIDAIAIDGVALLGSEIKEQQTAVKNNESMLDDSGVVASSKYSKTKKTNQRTIVEFDNIKIDLNKTPFINITWKIEKDLSGIKENTKKGHDFAARVFAVKKTGATPLSNRAINYVFSSNSDIGLNWPSPYTKKSIDYVLSTTKENLNEWVTVKTNVKDDFKKFHND